MANMAIPLPKIQMDNVLFIETQNADSNYVWYNYKVTDYKNIIYKVTGYKVL